VNTENREIGNVNAKASNFYRWAIANYLASGKKVARYLR